MNKAKNNKTPDDVKTFFERQKELRDSGMGFIGASQIANFEMQMAQWPRKWGNSLQVIIYGNFLPPEKILHFKTLGITIYPEKVENFCIKNALCAIKAKITVEERSVKAFIEATRKINHLLAIWKLNVYGNLSCGWWCWILHGIVGCGRVEGIEGKVLEPPFQDLMHLKDDVRQKVEAAMYWIRYPNSVLAHYHNDVLTVYTSYWNAFECLVYAVNIIKPRKKLTKKEKQDLINAAIKNNLGKLKPCNIKELHRIFEPAFKEKASHALKTCFNNLADGLIDECFKGNKKGESLYGIRNAINHGTIDSQDYKTMALISEKQYRLLEIVWSLFRVFLPSLREKN